MMMIMMMRRILMNLKIFTTIRIRFVLEDRMIACLPIPMLRSNKNHSMVDTMKLRLESCTHHTFFLFVYEHHRDTYVFRSLRFFSKLSLLRNRSRTLSDRLISQDPYRRS